MPKILTLLSATCLHRALKKPLILATSLGLVASQVTPALADIDNSATASGTYGGNPVSTPTPSEVHIPVQAGTPSLTVAKTAGTPVDTTGDGIIGPGDTITYTYVVTNTGNVTINDAVPVDSGPTFNGVAGTGAALSYTPTNADLAPQASQTFTADYVMTAEDAYRAAGVPEATGNAVQNTATATGTPATGTLAAVTPSSDETEIPANPRLEIVKKFAFLIPGGDVDGDGFADKDDKVVYTYEVRNTGNVPISGVTISDVHEGTPLLAGTVTNETLVTDGPLATASPAVPSSDAGIDASYDTLQPGGFITFTYTHTVTQAEVDGG